MEEVVLRDGGGKLLGVGEDVGPLFDSLDVLLHLTGIKSLRDLKGNEAELEGSLCIEEPASLLDISNASFDLWNHQFCALDA